MAISGVGKITDQGLLARTLSHMTTVNKTAAPQAVKEPTQVKRVNEGGAAQKPAATKEPAASQSKAAAPKQDQLQAPAVLRTGLDIKA